MYIHVVCLLLFFPPCWLLMYIMQVKRFFLHYFSVLKTFIHDPLVEWEKVKGRVTSAEATNEKV